MDLFSVRVLAIICIPGILGRTASPCAVGQALSHLSLAGWPLTKTNPTTLCHTERAMITSPRAHNTLLFVVFSVCVRRVALSAT